MKERNAVIPLFRPVEKNYLKQIVCNRKKM